MGSRNRNAPNPTTDKRRAILDAALSLFVERGFHGTAVPLVAERAGVGAGTIYRYFDNKEALVNELYRELKGSEASYIARDFPLRASAREQFHAFFSRLVTWGLDNPEGFAFLELHSHGSYLDSQSQSQARRGLEAGLRLIKAGQKSGALKKGPPRLLVSVLLGSIRGLLRLAWSQGPPPDGRSLELAEQCCWDAIRS